MNPTITEKDTRLKLSKLTNVEFRSLFDDISAWKSTKNVRRVKSIKVLTYSFDHDFLANLRELLACDNVRVCATRAPSIRGWPVAQNEDEKYVVMGSEKSHAKVILIEGVKHKAVAIGSFNATMASMAKIESAIILDAPHEYDKWNAIFDYLYNENIKNYRWHREERKHLTVEGVGTRIIELPSVSLPEPLVPFDFQEEIIRQMLVRLENEKTHKKGILVKMITGTGKTLVGAEILMRIRKPGQLALWIAPREELLEQAIIMVGQQCARLNYFVGIGYYKSQDIQVEFDDDRLNATLIKYGRTIDSADIIFSTYRSAAAVLGKIERKDSVAVLVVDEAHRFHSEAQGARVVFEDLVDENTIKIGLTGTPISTEGFEAYWHATQDKIITHKYTAAQFEEREILARQNNIRVEIGTISVPALQLGVVDVTDYEFENISGVRDFYSVEIDDSILENLKLSISKGRKRILVFLPTIKRCGDIVELIANNLHQEHIGDFDVMEHHSEVSCGLRSSNSMRFKQSLEKEPASLVMLTVQTASEGLDVPLIDCLLLVRPTFSKVLLEQMLGRGLRGPKLGGTKSCDIFDFTYTIEDSKGYTVSRREDGELKRECASDVNLQRIEQERAFFDGLPNDFRWRVIDALAPNNMTVHQVVDVARALHKKELIHLEQNNGEWCVKLRQRKIGIEQGRLIANLTLRRAIVNERIADISRITLLSISEVEDRLNSSGGMMGRVKYAFWNEWPRDMLPF